MAKKKFITVEGVKYEMRVGTEGADDISGTNIYAVTKGGNDRLALNGDSIGWTGDGLDYLQLGKGKMTVGTGPQDDVVIVTGNGDKKIWNGINDDQTYANKVTEGKLIIGLGEGNDSGVGGGDETTMYGGKGPGSDRLDSGTAKKFIGFGGEGTDYLKVGNGTLEGEFYTGNDTDIDIVDFSAINARAEIDAYLRDGDRLVFNDKTADLNDTTAFTINNITDEGFTITTTNGGVLNVHGVTAAEMGYTVGTDTNTDPGTDNPEEPLVSEDFTGNAGASALNHYFANDSLF